MAISKVVVVDGNNLTVRIDRGVAGRGVTDVQPIEIDNALYLEFFFSDGTTETVGPVGTIQYIGQAPIVVNASTISLSTVPVNLGGTGQVTANAGFNALAPSQTSNAGKYLKTDGTNAAWDLLDISTADITGVLPIANGGTNATTAAGARTSLNAADQDTTISAGTGLSGGGSLAANRTLSIANTAVTAGSYGSASNTLSATVNAQGQLTALAATPIAIANTQVSGLGTMSTQNSNAVTITGGSITGITDLAIVDGGTGASTAADARSNLGLGTAAVLNAGVANGVATLDAGGTVPLSQIPASIQGGVSYQGAWNASTNTPTLTSSVGTKGHYYVVSVSGNTNLNGVTDWLVGDWAIYNGSAWEKIDNTDQVASVNGYTGVVVLSNTDVGAPSTSLTISAGTGLTGGGDLTTNRTISIANTAVSAGSYGTASAVPSFTVNGQGQLTAAADTTIAIANTQVSGLGTMSTQNANAVAITGGTATLTSLTVNDNTTFGSSNSDTTTFNGRIASEFTPATNNTYDLGRNSHEWRNLYLTGTANISALTASGTVTLNGGTANGVAYLNGSKVLTSGAALTFDGSNFASTGIITSVNVNGLRAQYPSSAGYYAQLDSRDGNTHLSAVGSTAAIVFRATDGPGTTAEAMRLTSTGLGIGTSSPAAKLQVVDGNILLSNAYSLSARNAANTTSIGLILRNTSDQVVIDADGYGTLIGSGGVLGVFGSGNVGIGTSSPGYKLTVAGTGGSATVSLLETGVRSWGIRAGGAASGTFDIADFTAGLTRLTLDSSGNVGIGTSSPVGRLTIQGAAGTNGIDQGIGLLYSNGTHYGALGLNNSSGWPQLMARAGAGLTFHVNSDLLTTGEAMRLDSSGNLGIGTSSPAAGYKTTIAGNSAWITAGANFTIEPDAASGANGVDLKASFTAGGNGPLKLWTGGAERMRLDASGNLGLGVTPSAWSGYKAMEFPYGGSVAGYDGSAVPILAVSSNAYFVSGVGDKYVITGPASRYLQNQGVHAWYTASSGTAGDAITFTQALTLDASGRLGVGATSLSSYGVTAERGGSDSVYFTANNTSGYNFIAGVAPALGYGLLGMTTNHALAFITNNTERARITGAGFFKASNSAAYVDASGLYHELIKTSDNADWAVFIGHSGATASNQYGTRVNLQGDPNTAGNEFLYCSGGATLRASIRANGGIANYQSNDSNLSDRREKNNFAPAKSYLETICAIPVQTFNYIDQSEEDPGLTLGVVAQDVQAVAPELVMESNWGTQDEPKMRLSIYQTDLQYALMKCIQEQQAIITALTARVAALESI